MQLNIQARGFDLTGALRQHVERRLAFALSRFEQRLSAVSLRLTDDNGPRGGVDKRCVLHLRMTGFAETVISERADNLYVAIDRVADRAARAVARHLRRQRDSVFPSRVAGDPLHAAGRMT